MISETGAPSRARVYYKGQADRRAIADCLQEIAEIKYKQHKQAETLDYLERALLIRVWLNDQYQIDKIQKKMVQINKSQ